MQADVQPLLIFHMDLGIALKSFCFRYLRLTVRAGGSEFGLSMDQIVARSGGHPLGELSPMIRHQFPVRMLFGLWADGDVYPVQRPVVGPISGAKDQRIGLLGFVLALFFGSLELVFCLWR